MGFYRFLLGTLSANGTASSRRKTTMAFHPSFFFHPKPKAKAATPVTNSEKPGKTV
jgi:hypothetical protein